MGFTVVTVSGSLKDAAGNNLSGQIVFTLTKPIQNGGVVVPASPVTATVTAGTFSVQLYATDDTGTTPNDAFYGVTEELNNGTGQAINRDYTIQLLGANGTAQTLDNLAPGAQIWQ